MIVLYDYWRSSAAYRLRIALNLMELDYRSVPVDLLTGEHSAEENLARNPQGLVPTLEIDGQTLTQSLAIVEYLDETRDAGFLPEDPRGRARVQATVLRHRHGDPRRLQPVGREVRLRPAGRDHHGELDGQVHSQRPRRLRAHARRPGNRALLPWRSRDHGRHVPGATALQREALGDRSGALSRDPTDRTKRSGNSRLSRRRIPSRSSRQAEALWSNASKMYEGPERLRGAAR